MNEISAFFTPCIGAYGKQGACAEVVAWLASGELDPAQFGAIVSRHGVGRERRFRYDMLDLVIEYARHRLSTRLLTLDDITDIQLLANPTVPRRQSTPVRTRTPASHRSGQCRTRTDSSAGHDFTRAVRFTRVAG
jgi:hypothetical protein